MDLSAKFEKSSIHGNYYQMAIIDVKSKYVWDFYLETKDQVYPKLKEWLETEIAAHRGRDPSGFEIVLFSDKGEALSKDVEQECIKYGVRRETTAGYTPAHNAFIERWFRTNSEMSRCQMIQYNMDDTYWEDSRAMATFIYNRVPPSTRIEGEPWISPLQKQYPKRVSMDMSKIRPFGLTCYVFQKKERRNVGYHGKSDKKEHAKKGVLIGYDDQKGTLLVKVYYPKENTYAWVDEQLVTYADPLLALDKVRKGKVLVLPKEVQVFYFKPLIGMRHTDPENGLLYETVEDKINREGYIVAFRPPAGVHGQKDPQMGTANPPSHPDLPRRSPLQPAPPPAPHAE